MTFTTFKALTAAVTATLFSASHAHLILKSPVPYGLDSLNNSPLVDAAPGSSDSDYPCKLRSGVYDISAMNNMKVGETQELSFTGSASHGGGTCQLAYTTDLEPAANSTFKVFQVFEGGCPISASGNDGTHPFTFVLPEGTPNGRLTMAWIWYNRIGNREIYMNCAPLDVTGGSDKMDFYHSLPNAYIINLPTQDCSTVESSNPEIPFPGQFVLKDDSTSIAAASGPSCSKSAAAMTEGVSGYKSATVSNGAATQAPAQNHDATGSASGGGGGSAAATATSGAAAGGSTSFLTVSTTAAAVSSAYPTLTPSGGGVAQSSGYASPSGTTGSGGSMGTCSNNGGIVCNGPSQFGVCNNGQVVWQQVADGTKCENGKVQKRSSIAFQRPHVRRHALHAASH